MSQNLRALGDLKLRNLCMPGSHDAGMSQLTHSTFGVTDLNAITQKSNIGQQLLSGVRYFDLRVIIGGGEYWTGHYEQSRCLGGRGESIQTIIDAVNQFTEDNNELIILDLSHAMNTDNCGTLLGLFGNGYPDFKQDEWTRLFALLFNPKTGLKHVFKNKVADLTTLTLNSFIANGPAIVLRVDYSGTVPSGIIKYEKFDIYNKYANTDNLQTMIDDQIEKMKEIRTDIDSDMFLLSWTLTQTASQAGKCGVDPLASFDGACTGILQLASQANDALKNVYDETTDSCFPNIILTDDAANAGALDICQSIYQRFIPDL